MTEFDLSTLERALSSKGRKPRQDLSLKPALSKRELWDEALRLGREMDHIYSRNLWVRCQGATYRVRYGELLTGCYKRVDIDEAHYEVLERLVANGRKRLKNYHDMVNQVIQECPVLALEANLEGHSGSTVLEFIYDKRLEQILTVLHQRISSPKETLFINLSIMMRPPLGTEFAVAIKGWLNRSSVIVEGIELRAKTPAEIAKLVHFLTYFEQVIDGMNRQIDNIEIKKEVIQ